MSKKKVLPRTKALLKNLKGTGICTKRSFKDPKSITKRYMRRSSTKKKF